MRPGSSIVLALLAAVFLPAVCFSQSTLNFPRVMRAQDFATTGFALVNPAGTPAAVTFTLYGADGNSAATSAQSIPARGQLSRLARELFPNVTATGWVQASTATVGIQGFWFGGDFSSFADGAEAAQSSTELVVPLMGPQTEINIANTGTADVTLLLDLLGIDGFDVAMPYPQHIPAKGFLRADMASIFPLEDLSLPSHLRITCRCNTPSPFAATVIARDFLAGPSWVASNGVPAAGSALTLFFPHLVEGPQGTSIWRTVVGVTNLNATSPNEVVLTFTSESGSIVRTNVQTIPPNGQIRFSARDLFQITNEFQNGWVQVVSRTGLPITGYIAYADLVAAGVAVVPPQQTAQPKLLFSHIADLAPWLTGLALLNTNAMPASIQIFAFTPAGSLVGGATLGLQPGTNTARLLGDLIPQTRTRTSDGGFVFVQSNVPIHGIELFFLRNNQAIANVPAANGNTFVAPQ